MKLLITFLALIPLTVFAQKTDTTALRKKIIGFTFSPDYSYRTLRSTDDFSEFIKDHRNAYEMPKMGFTAGFNLRKEINKRFSFELGFLFSDKGEKTKKYDIYPSSGQVDPLVPLYVSYNYHISYLDIPCKINYYLLRKKAKFFLSGGLSPSLFLFERVSSSYEYMDGHTSKNSSSSMMGYSRINLSFLAGFGMDYSLSDKLNLRFEPIFRSSIIPIVNAPIKGYLYSVGMNMGVYFSL